MVALCCESSPSVCVFVHTRVPEQGLHLCAGAVHAVCVCMAVGSVFVVGSKVPALSMFSAPGFSQLLFHKASTALLARVPSF